MGKNFPRPDGGDCVQGENIGGLPSRGTKIGMGSNCCADGSDMSQDATNSMGSIRSDCKSDGTGRIKDAQPNTNAG